MTINDPRAELVRLLPRLRRFAYGLTGNSEQADDLVQAGCLKALERWFQWQEGTSLASWMFRILQTTWLDDYRALQRHKTDAATDELLELVGDDGRLVVEQRSETRAVRRLVAALPPEQSAVLLLVTVDGLSYKDAAATLGVPIGTVMSRLARARAKLAQELNQ